MPIYTYSPQRWDFVVVGGGMNRLDTNSSKPPTTTSSLEAESELLARGVNDSVAAKLGREADPDLVVAWCSYAAAHPSMGPGAIVTAIRRGLKPAQRRSDLEEQKRYGESIAEWLLASMPEACGVSPEIVAWERRVYGDEAAEGLARADGPHPAAVAAVLKLHYQHGRRSLTVGEHGQLIRDAVAASDAEAIEHYRAIAATRESEAA